MKVKYIYSILVTGLMLIFSCNGDLQEETTELSKQKSAQSQKEDKVSEAIDFLNDVFVEDTTIRGAAPGANPPPAISFAKSNIDTIYNLPDENNKPFLNLVVFKPSAYALISVIKNVPNPPVLYYSADKFDLKNPSVGLLNYIQDFLATATKVSLAVDPQRTNGVFFTQKHH